MAVYNTSGRGPSTTLAVGEEDGGMTSFSGEEVRGGLQPATSAAVGEEDGGGDSPRPPVAVTSAIGEDVHGGWQTATTAAVGEEDGGFSPGSMDPCELRPDKLFCTFEDPFPVATTQSYGIGEEDGASIYRDPLPPPTPPVSYDQFTMMQRLQNFFSSMFGGSYY